MAGQGTSKRIRRNDSAAAQRAACAKAPSEEAMSRRRHRAALLPGHWSPQQALAAFELIELLRDQLWQQYRCCLQSALRADRKTCTDPAHRPIPENNDPPF